MVTARGSEHRWSRFLAPFLCCAGGVVAATCGFSESPTGEPGTGGDATSTTSGTTGNSGGSANPAGGTGGSNAVGAGGANTGAGGDVGMAGAGMGGGIVMDGRAKNYEVSGTFPTWPVAIQQKPGTLKYTKILIHNQFLAESCSIGDYNGDGIPDVSAGRVWYQGPDFKTSHAFRDGHGVLPSLGNGPEIDTGVADDWACYPFDMDGDGDTDIINIAQCDVDEINKTNPKVGTVQPHATAYWYENPGKAGLAGDPMWTKHLMASDVRLEQHGLVDMNGDGYPEIYAACKNCVPATTKGYYQGDPKNPMGGWAFHSVTVPYTFPFGGTGWLHGEGAGDVNGDGLPDLLERGGAWLQQPGGMWNQTVCTGKNVPAGCGWIKTNLFDGITDTVGNKGASHMYAVDMDKDGLTDIVAADWAHGVGLYWYKQGPNFTFTKYQFMGDSQLDKPADVTKWGAGFTEPHALQVVDMDGDGRPDVVTGKMRFAHPHGYGDPDSDSTPYLYVFKNVATPDARTGSPITLQPVLVDPLAMPPGAPGTPDGGMGVGRQLAVGHVNTDGIMDICVATKVGLAVFLGQ
jgi:hypothetical protein